VKLIACPQCHAQYDVTSLVPDSSFDCRCGEVLQATALKGTDASVQRCSSCGALARERDERCDYCGAAIVPIADRGSLICPECYARNADDARFCLGCGVAFDPQPIRSDTPELRCPCCERWMSARTVGDLEIQECPECHGIWAPEDRFDALVDRAMKAARERVSPENESIAPRVDGGNPAESKVEYRRCPVCDALMIRRNFQRRSGVIIDRCHQHGTWLDAHELERIAGFVLSGRAAEARRIEAAYEAERERQAARLATRNARSGSWGSEETGSIFTAGPSTTVGSGRARSPAELLFDLLNGWLS
jgi:Zn-finger nucleic acid-binding protein